MALNLKNQQTLKAIDELARITGDSKSEAVASAVEERLAMLHAQTIGAPDPAAARWDRVRVLMADGAARFARAGWGPDAHGEYLDPTAQLYGHEGLPR